MIQRDILAKIRYMATKFPVVTLTGPRQSGKSTALKDAFSNYNYITLEDPDIRLLAETDPRNFLANLGKQVILDEIQNVPSLLSYIQGIVDKTGESGQYILSGSHNFLLMESITQSLAGRTAILKLLPLSRKEMVQAKIDNPLNELLYTGSYPRIYDKNIPATDFYPSYIQTYLERDVRLLRTITDLSTFMRFVKLCAARTGQLLNVSSLANEASITVATANAWLSILETSYILFQLKPFHKNYNKRLVKSTKIYFYDTGLACSLLGLSSSKQIEFHYLRGELFENWCLIELMKNAYAQGVEPSIYFWRDSNGNEVDLLIEKGEHVEAIEIKSSATLQLSHFKGLKNWQKTTGNKAENCKVIYGGDMNYLSEFGAFVSWKSIDQEFK